MIRHSIYFLTIICFCISGCASTKQTYEELTDEAAITKDYTKVEAFEASVIKAESYFQVKRWCAATKECIWLCIHHGVKPWRPRNQEYPIGIDQLVKWWRQERMSCGTSTVGDIERIFRTF